MFRGDISTKIDKLASEINLYRCPIVEMILELGN